MCSWVLAVLYKLYFPDMHNNTKRKIFQQTIWGCSLLERPHENFFKCVFHLWLLFISVPDVDYYKVAFSGFFFNFLCEHTALGFHFFQITSIIRLASSTAILIYSSYMKSLAILVSCTDNSLVDQFQDILQYMHLFYQYCFWRENKNNYSKLNALDWGY